MLMGYDADAVADVMGLTIHHAATDAAQSGVRDEGVPMIGFADGPAPMTGQARKVSSSPLMIEQAVERGLPRQVLRHVAERIAGGDKAKMAALEWGIVPKTTLERRATTLSPQESERTERVARVFVHARRALGSEDEARAFVTTTHPELDGRSPIEVARTDLGTRRVEQLLNALEYGLVL